MPHNATLPPSSVGEVYTAEVIERPAMRNGEPIYQAQIVMPQPGTNHTGNQRVFNIRGPPRKAREQAECDANKLTDISTSGPKAVRALANQLHRGSTSQGDH